MPKRSGSESCNVELLLRVREYVQRMRPLYLQCCLSADHRNRRELLQNRPAFIRMERRFGQFHHLYFLAEQPVGAGVLRDLHFFFFQVPFRLLLRGYRFGVFVQLRLPFRRLTLGSFYIHQVQGDVLPIAPLHAVKVHTVRQYLVFTDNMIAAILHVQLEVCRPGGTGQNHESRHELPHISRDYDTAPPVSALRIGELPRPLFRIGVQEGP